MGPSIRTPGWRHVLAAMGMLLLGTLPAEGQAGSASASSSGPFEIRETTRSIASGAFPNRPNLFSRTTVSEWRLSYKGQPVSVQTGDGRQSEFYEAWFLAGAPAPAVLLALGDFYLVTEAEGRAAVSRVSAGREDDFGRYQWLDADHGQPSAEQGVYVRDRRGEPRTLSGGSLLLLNSNAVLDVATLRVVPVRAPLHDVALADYGVADAPARALSPDKRQYVLAGSVEQQGASKTALIVIEFHKDRGYAVPYDPRATQSESMEDVTPAWLHRNFEWKKEANGSLRLAAKAASARTSVGR